MTIRPIEAGDVDAIVDLVRELADYEQSLEEATMTPEQLRAALFGPTPALFGHVASDATGSIVGFALWFLNFSTWRGTHGIYLEDLYVSPAHRGTGLGRDLLRTLAVLCTQRGYSRLEWSVLDWNEPAINFYQAAGARPQDGWSVFRLTDSPGRTALTDFARERTP